MMQFYTVAILLVLFVYLEEATFTDMIPAIGNSHTGVHDVAMSGQGAASHLYIYIYISMSSFAAKGAKEIVSILKSKEGKY